MNWNAVGAVGQILESLATFVTVALLAIQIHDSEDAVRRAIAQTRAERDMQMLLEVADNEHLGALDVKLAIFTGNKTDLHPLPKSNTADAIGSFIAVAQQADLTIA